jgi:hypothetical protein
MRKLAAWMREVGATRARTRHGEELELGDAPPAEARSPREQLTEEQRTARRLEQTDRVMFASSTQRPRRRLPG